MKRSFFMFTFFLAFTLVATAQELQTQPAETPAPASGAAIEFESMEVDYGTIVQGADPYRVFRFTNTGTAELLITNARGSCGCTVPTYPKEAIPPGESGEIQVRYDTNRVGPFTKRVTLTTNASDAEIVLTIKGKVDQKAAEPEGVPAVNEGMFKNN